MSSDHREIVIVRRRSTLEDEHHGGAWKIAFADFMTAMMAFFLVLWIISATDKNTKTIIARYFNPVKVEEPARSQKGIHGAEDLNVRTPSGDSGARGVGKSRLDQDESFGKSPTDAHEGTPADGRQLRQSDTRPPDPARPMPTMSEEELFSDPRASLDRISGGPPLGSRVGQASGFGDAGPISEYSHRDPFRPMGGDEVSRPTAAIDPTALPGAPQEEAESTTAQSPPEARLRRLQKDDPTGEEIQQQPMAKYEPQKPGPTFDESKSPSVPASASAKSETAPTAAAFQAPTETTRERAAALLADVKRRLGPETPSAPGPKLDVQATDEGILVSLTDRQNFSMFAIGSAEPQPRVVHMMDAIATSLAATPGAIVVRGHTDARPYRSGLYDNWRLSSARAQMAYYMLNRAGIPDKRFERIEGFADHRLKDQARPFAAENRRIEILLREAKP